MSIEYTLTGEIPVKGRKRDLIAAINRLRREIDGMPAECYYTLEDGYLRLDLYTTSHSTYERIEELVPKFAEKWASEPATLDTRYEQDEDEMVVGPKGYDRLAYEIKCIDAELLHLNARRAELLRQHERLRREKGLRDDGVRP